MSEWLINIGVKNVFGLINGLEDLVKAKVIGNVSLMPSIDYFKTGKLYNKTKRT